MELDSSFISIADKLVSDEPKEQANTDDKEKVLAYIHEEFDWVYSRFDELALETIKETMKKDRAEEVTFAGFQVAFSHHH